MDRPRLLSRLHASLDAGAPTVALWATAGAGKSALLDGWRSHLESSGLQAAAFDSASPTGSLEQRVTDFLDESRGGAPRHVMVDDAHLCEGADREWLAEFVAARDPGISIYLAGRYPPSALARIAASGPVIEIRSDALAFTRDEAEEFFRLRHVCLSERNLDAVHIKTEGWAVALTLLADRLAAADDVENLIDDFASDQRGVADYLVADVLSSKEPAVEHFLLQTCIVDDLTVPLAAHLTGRPDAGEVLTVLDEQNSLIHRVGGHDPVYRSHAMLTSYLRANLRRQDLTEARELHLRAADWYASHGDYEQALMHTLESDEPAAVVEALDRHGARLVFGGKAYLVLRALDRLDEAGQSTAGCHVLAALITAPYFSDRVRADYHFALAQTHADELSVQSRVLLSAMLVMRCAEKQQESELRDAITGLDRSMDAARQSPGDDWLDAALFAEAASGWGALQGDDVQAGLDVLKAAAAEARSAKRTWLHLLLLDLAASAAARLGRWAETHEIQEEMRHSVAAEGRPHDLVSARVQFAVAAAAYDQAEPYALSRMADIISADKLALDAGLSVPAAVLRVLLRIDDVPNPRKLYEELDRILQASGHSNRRTLAAVFFRYLDLTIRLRGRSQARSVAAFVSTVLGPDCLEARVAHFMLAQGTSSQVAEERALTELLEGDFRAWNPSNIVIGWLLLAHSAESSGRVAAADQLVEEALDLARPMNARRPFLAARGMGGALLASRTGRLGVNEEFAASIVDLYRALHPTEGPSELGSIVFTTKEHEILRELPRHQSVADIALKQRLSPNTIKTHLRSIYQKLGVTGRAEAVEKAMAAGLL